MKVRWTPQSLRFPALKGKLIVYASRGQMYVRSWPRKRGPSKSAQVRRQVEWFKQANKLAKELEPTQQALAIAMTKGTGLYPRDLLLHQMSGGIYDIIDEDGVNYQTKQDFRETVVFQGCIQEQSAGQSLPADIETTLTWQLPVLDTLAFWNVATPTLFTIPEGINVVELTAGWAPTENPGNTITIISLFHNGARLTRDAQDETGLPGHTTGSGPRKVLIGDTLLVKVFTNRLFTTALGGLTRFTLNVLDAD